MDNDKFQNKYRIPSARAQWHDYAGGIYFITICTHQRENYFGDIIVDENGEPKMNLSEIGKCANECWQSIPQHFPHVETPLWTVMPNHIHGIVIIHNISDSGNGILPVETQNFASRMTTNQPTETQNFASLRFGPQSQNLASVIRGFKIGVTKFANQNNIPFQWQTRFHDHIVRNQNELNHIAEYIENNVAKWAYDELNDCRDAKFCVSTDDDKSTNGDAKFCVSTEKNNEK